MVGIHLHSGFKTEFCFVYNLHLILIPYLFTSMLGQPVVFKYLLSSNLVLLGQMAELLKTLYSGCQCRETIQL